MLMTLSGTATACLPCHGLRDTAVAHHARTATRVSVRSAGTPCRLVVTTNVGGRHSEAWRWTLPKTIAYGKEMAPPAICSRQTS